MSRSATGALPWSVKSQSGVNGVTIHIVDACGGVVALMKNGGGRKADNANLIVAAVNKLGGWEL